jgi:hypothetical protein
MRMDGFGRIEGGERNFGRREGRQESFQGHGE